MAKPQSPETVLGIEQDPDTVGKLFVLLVCVLYTLYLIQKCEYMYKDIF